MVKLNLVIGDTLIDGVVEMPAGKGRFQARLESVDVDPMVKGLMLLDGGSDGFEVSVIDNRRAEETVAVDATVAAKPKTKD
jgi:hypothetical protein